MLAEPSYPDNVNLWNVTSRRLLKVLSSAPGASTASDVTGLAFSPDGRFLAAHGAAHDAAIWDVASGTQLQTFNKVNGLAFSPNSQTLALAVTGDKLGEIHLWSVTSHTLGSPLSDTASAVNGVAYSPDGTTLASIDSAGTVSFWNTSTGKASAQPSFVGATSQYTQAYGIVFSPDGKTLATFDELTIMLWDLQANRQLVRPILDPRNFYEVSFTPDGQYLVEPQAGGPIILRFARPTAWATEACSIANRNFTQAEWKAFVGDEPYKKICPDLPVGT